MTLKICCAVHPRNFAFVAIVGQPLILLTVQKIRYKRGVWGFFFPFKVLKLVQQTLNKWNEIAKTCPVQIE